MISFKKFVLENDAAAYRLQQVMPDEFIEWCESRCPRYLENISNRANPRIYRGSTTENSAELVLGKINTNNFNRVSANTINYYTIWMDNHPDWSSYPKRSKSLICSTSIRTASGYGGDVFLVFPADSNKIGVCPESDLWYSFYKMFTNDLTSMEQIMQTIRAIFRDVGIPSADIKEAEKSYETLIKCLDQCTIDSISNANEKARLRSPGDHHVYQVDELIEKMQRKSYDSLYDMWDACMSPSANGFGLQTGGDFEEASKDSEVWVQGECVMVRLDYLSSISIAKESRLREFFNKHKIIEREFKHDDI